MFTLTARCGEVRSLTLTTETVEDARMAAKTVLVSGGFTTLQVFDADGSTVARWDFTIGWLQEGDVFDRCVLGH